MEGQPRFVSQQIDAEADLKRNTVGLVQLDDFQKIRESVAKQKKNEKGDAKSAQKTKRSNEAQSAISKTKLSFDDEEGDDESAFADISRKKKQRIGKDPTVNTSFLPDKYRDAQESDLKKELRKQWLERQKLVKEEIIEVKFVMVDGSQSVKAIPLKKADTVKEFLTKARDQVPSIQGAPLDTLMYVIQDVIIHLHYTFYELILNKAAGSGGLFFELEHYADLSQKELSDMKDKPVTVGKVLRREWYDQNKHIYPASRWKYYDPLK